jgi:hypothetical protein
VNEKFELFTELPPELKKIVARKLPTPDLEAWFWSAKSYQTLFKPSLEVRDFLPYVVQGQYKEVKKMLQENSDFFFEKGIVEDCSGRVFDDINCLEYAFWAWDQTLWDLIFECLPQEPSLRRLILNELRSQHEHMQHYGISYTLNGNFIREIHFDFENTIIKALKIQVKLLDEALNLKNMMNLPLWDELAKQWVEGVGGAQNLVPMNVVYWYCTRPNQEPSQKFYNYHNEVKEDWFGKDSKLGKEFAIYLAGPEESRANAI